MSGFVVDSNHTSYIGTVVHLVVEDNAENPRVPDRLTWAFCRPGEGGWVPSDAERKDDDGAYWKWWATDAERDDDVGIPSVDLLSNAGDCQVLPLGRTTSRVRKGKAIIVHPYHGAQRSGERESEAFPQPGTAPGTLSSR